MDHLDLFATLPSLNDASYAFTRTRSEPPRSDAVSDEDLQCLGASLGGQSIARLIAYDPKRILRGYAERTRSSPLSVEACSSNERESEIDRRETAPTSTAGHLWGRVGGRKRNAENVQRFVVSALQECTSVYSLPDVGINLHVLSSHRSILGSETEEGLSRSEVETER